jgi:hypothetical protein
MVWRPSGLSPALADPSYHMARGELGELPSLNIIRPSACLCFAALGLSVSGLGSPSDRQAQAVDVAGNLA